MLGFNHALESSASSSSSLSSSILSLYDTNSPLEFDAEKLETNHVKEKNDETNVFLKHLRKAFITIDENCYCEHSVLPDLKIFSYKNKLTKKKKRDEHLRSVLQKRINLDSYEYVQIQSMLIL
jgi:hypothetical protein